MNGTVERLHALLPVTFRLPNQPDFVLPFVIDTGYTGELTLPLAAVETMQLGYLYDETARLADDTETKIPVYGATIVWLDKLREVRILATGQRPLLGTGLLDGCELVSQFAEGGLVTVELL